MIKIRELKKKDINYFNELIISESTSYENFTKMGWSLKEISNQLSKSVNLAFGVFYKNLLISFIFGDLFNIEKISEYEILVMYVCKNYRKKGFGSKLLTIIEENNKNLKKIYLEVGKNNLEGISFYKKMNFKKIDIRKNYFLLDNKKIDALLMCKSL